MKKIVLILSLFVFAHGTCQNTAYSDQSSTDKFYLKSIYNTSDYTVVVFSGFMVDDYTGTLHKPGGKSPYILKTKNGSVHALVKQAGWNGPGYNGFGTRKFMGGESVMFKLYFEKVNNLDNISGVVEKDCYGSNCWSFEKIKIYKDDADEFDPHNDHISITNFSLNASYDSYNNNNKKGVELSINMTVKGLKSKPLALTVRVKNRASGQFEIPNHYAKFDYNYDEKKLNPDYDESVFNDIKLFVPYDEIILDKGKNNLSFDIDLIVDDAQHELIKHLKTQNWHLTN
ncbi:hypothetical protein [Urechidicola vernalis]|uniref:Uncharacterized protein n=1 Tax=Urechidicola vernalis TaxID=3075600 RepID=A0ABU2Y4W5_9FLAO|nr:hypothetical protein [Urechidicola sp. P050]MDT0552866.1 hypothetical protein [Urechidicola sp. P050]